MEPVKKFFTLVLKDYLEMLSFEFLSLLFCLSYLMLKSTGITFFNDLCFYVIAWPA